MKTLSISQVQRELHHLDNFDIVEIVDKKRDIVKGYFIDSKYKSVIDALVAQEKKQSFSTFAGMWEGRDIDQQTLREHAWRR
ncbi:MAG: hypothetical protein PHV62_01055 [Sulfuricurvum sp.]|nr:hypothetical protein [Sulfuricurvum sp.]